MLRAKAGVRPESERAGDEGEGAFYPGPYLAPLLAGKAGAKPAIPRDLRASGKRTLLVIPERLANGAFSPCAYIRLLLPYTHPSAGEDLELFVIAPDQAELFVADAVLTHRYALPDRRAARRLITHCRKHGMRLVYDLDDDLLGLPKDHPEAAVLGAKKPLVAELVKNCDRLTLSTPQLARRLGAEPAKTLIVPNALDERLWAPVAARHGMDAPLAGPIRLLVMGTRTHRADFALIAGALGRLVETFGDRISIDVCGMTTDPLPKGVNALTPVPGRAESYPGFVAWLARQFPWHIGIAPLAEQSFNAAKSPIKLFDYAALGLAIAASDVAPYRDLIEDGRNGLLVPNSEAAWFEALAHLIRHPRRIAELAESARVAFYAPNTLAAAQAARRALIDRLFAPAA